MNRATHPEEKLRCDSLDDFFATLRMSAKSFGVIGISCTVVVTRFASFTFAGQYEAVQG